MDAKVNSIAAGNDSFVSVEIECHISNGLPNIIIVGFANKAVDEAKERVRGAFSGSKLDLPKKRITINLAPADLPKDSPNFDLGIAMSILAASGQIDKSKLKGFMFLGELGLDGKVRAVRGVIGALISARNAGYDKFYIPSDNLEQAKLIPGITLIPLRNLKEAYLDITGASSLAPIETVNGSISTRSDRSKVSDFSFIVGQKRAKRALEIAAAGGHNVLLNGPPGTGKSMLAKALPTIMTPLDISEVLEVTHLHSLASRRFDSIITERPFRAPHHSASDISIIGGGQRPKPGEISLSHRGVLFFDELPEFSRPTIEALRQPMEDKTITVARAKDSLTFPADFILVATSNPCPCGFYGTGKDCSCLPHQIIKYQRRLSGPILDRIDLYVDVDNVQHKSLLGNSNEETSQEVAKRVKRAREHQRTRYKTARTNANLSNQDIKRHARLVEDAKGLLDKAADQLDLSPRSYMKLIKVARTIADIDDSDSIEVEHMSEALQYRRPKQTL